MTLLGRKQGLYLKFLFLRWNIHINEHLLFSVEIIFKMFPTYLFIFVYKVMFNYNVMYLFILLCLMLYRTAERARPLDDYNNGVVMTHRPLYDNELFEIRIDRLVDKWSGSIEVVLLI